MQNKFWQFLSKVGKYAIAMATGYEIGDSIKKDQVVAVPKIEVKEVAVSESKMAVSLLYVILAKLIGIIILFVIGLIWKIKSIIAKKGVNKFKHTLEFQT